MAEVTSKLQVTLPKRVPNGTVLDDNYFGRYTAAGSSRMLPSASVSTITSDSAGSPASCRMWRGMVTWPFLPIFTISIT